MTVSKYVFHRINPEWIGLFDCIAGRPGDEATQMVYLASGEWHGTAVCDDPHHVSDAARTALPDPAPSTMWDHHRNGYITLGTRAIGLAG